MKKKSQNKNEPHKFTGYERDIESGLDYAHARSRDINLGFISTDPMWWKYPHLSPYAYASNNPIMRIDPDGNTDYVNEAGKIVYNDGVDNGEYRTLSNKAWAAIKGQFGSAYKSDNKKPLEFWSALQNNSKEIIFENASTDFTAMWNESVSSSLEKAGFVIFDFDNATVRFEEVNVSNATSTEGTIPEYKAGDKYAGGIILANVHTHPIAHTFLGKMSTQGIVTDAMNFNNQYSPYGTDGSLGDGMRAMVQSANYTIEKYNVDYFSTKGRNASINNVTTRGKLQNNQFNLLKHALIQYGK